MDVALPTEALDFMAACIAGLKLSAQIKSGVQIGGEIAESVPLSLAMVEMCNSSPVRLWALRYEVLIDSYRGFPNAADEDSRPVVKVSRSYLRSNNSEFIWLRLRSLPRNLYLLPVAKLRVTRPSFAETF